jgi:UDP-N-acetylmuramoyl-tripeptide--D-alanyl-D-alanine ligase
MGFEKIYLLGNYASDVASGAVAGGIVKSEIFTGANHDELFKAIKKDLRKGDLILVKGSRGMKMEMVSEKIFAEMED